MTNPQKIQLTPWHGGKCPVDDQHAKVAVLYRDGDFGILNKPQYATWIHMQRLADIMAYAVIETETIEPPHSTIIPPEVWAVLPDEFVFGET